MKKNSILASLLAICFVAGANAALPTGATPFDVNVPSLCGGPTLGLTGIRWETGAPEYDYALVYPALANVLLFRRDGSYQTIDPDTRWNFKVTFGYIFPCSGSDLTLGYLNFHQNNNEYIVANNTTVGLILPTLSGNWPAQDSILISDPVLSTRLLTFTADPTLVTANTVINHDALDFDYGQSINVGSQLRIKVYGGIRYATLNNRLDVGYNFNNSYPVDIVDSISLTGVTINQVVDFTEQVSQSSSYEGVGLHFGTHFNYYLCWGFGLVGDASGSLLVGNTDTNLADSFKRSMAAIVIQSDIATLPVGQVFENLITQDASVHMSQRRIVPNFDARVGIDWSYQYHNCAHSKLNIEVGYMVSHYFNAIDRISEVAIEQPEFRPFHKMGEHFDGFYIGIQFNA